MVLLELPEMTLRSAEMDVLGVLPGPPSKGNASAGHILGFGEAFAYGVASSVAIVDVRLRAFLLPLWSHPWGSDQ